MAEEGGDGPMRASAAQLAKRKIKTIPKKRPTPGPGPGPASSFGSVSSNGAAAAPFATSSASTSFTFGQPPSTSAAPASNFSFSSSFPQFNSNPFAQASSDTSSKIEAPKPSFSIFGQSQAQPSAASAFGSGTSLFAPIPQAFSGFGQPYNPSQAGSNNSPAPNSPTKSQSAFPIFGQSNPENNKTSDTSSKPSTPFSLFGQSQATTGASTSQSSIAPSSTAPNPFAIFGQPKSDPPKSSDQTPANSLFTSKPQNPFSSFGQSQPDTNKSELSKSAPSDSAAQSQKPFSLFGEVKSEAPKATDTSNSKTKTPFSIFGQSQAEVSSTPAASVAPAFVFGTPSTTSQKNEGTMGNRVSGLRKEEEDGKDASAAPGAKRSRSDQSTSSSIQTSLGAITSSAPSFAFGSSVPLSVSNGNTQTPQAWFDPFGASSATPQGKPTNNLFRPPQSAPQGRNGNLLSAITAKVPQTSTKTAQKPLPAFESSVANSQASGFTPNTKSASIPAPNLFSAFGQSTPLPPSDLRSKEQTSKGNADDEPSSEHHKLTKSYLEREFNTDSVLGISASTPMTHSDPQISSQPAVTPSLFASSPEKSTNLDAPATPTPSATASKGGFSAFSGAESPPPFEPSPSRPMASVKPYTAEWNRFAAGSDYVTRPTPSHSVTSAQPQPHLNKYGFMTTQPYQSSPADVSMHTARTDSTNVDSSSFIPASPIRPSQTPLKSILKKSTSTPAGSRQPYGINNFAASQKSTPNFRPPSQGGVFSNIAQKAQATTSNQSVKNVKDERAAAMVAGLTTFRGKSDLEQYNQWNAKLDFPEPPSTFSRAQIKEYYYSCEIWMARKSLCHAILKAGLFADVRPQFDQFAELIDTIATKYGLKLPQGAPPVPKNMRKAAAAAAEPAPPPPKAEMKDASVQTAPLEKYVEIVQVPYDATLNSLVSQPQAKSIIAACTMSSIGISQGVTAAPSATQQLFSSIGSSAPETGKSMSSGVQTIDEGPTEQSPDHEFSSRLDSPSVQVSTSPLFSRKEAVAPASQSQLKSAFLRPDKNEGGTAVKPAQVGFVPRDLEISPVRNSAPLPPPLEGTPPRFAPTASHDKTPGPSRSQATDSPSVLKRKPEEYLEKDTADMGRDSFKKHKFGTLSTDSPKDFTSIKDRPKSTPKRIGMGSSVSKTTSVFKNIMQNNDEAESPNPFGALKPAAPASAPKETSTPFAALKAAPSNPFAILKAASASASNNSPNPFSANPVSPNPFPGLKRFASQQAMFSSPAPSTTSGTELNFGTPIQPPSSQSGPGLSNLFGTPAKTSFTPASAGDQPRESTSSAQKRTRDDAESDVDSAQEEWDRLKENAKRPRLTSEGEEAAIVIDSASDEEVDENEPPANHGFSFKNQSKVSTSSPPSSFFGLGQNDNGSNSRASSVFDSPQMRAQARLMTPDNIFGHLSADNSQHNSNAPSLAASQSEDDDEDEEDSSNEGAKLESEADTETGSQLNDDNDDDDQSHAEEESVGGQGSNTFPSGKLDVGKSILSRRKVVEPSPQQPKPTKSLFDRIERDASGNAVRDTTVADSSNLDSSLSSLQDTPENPFKQHAVSSPAPTFSFLSAATAGGSEASPGRNLFSSQTWTPETPIKFGAPSAGAIAPPAASPATTSLFPQVSSSSSLTPASALAPGNPFGGSADPSAATSRETSPGNSANTGTSEEEKGEVLDRGAEAPLLEGEVKAFGARAKANLWSMENNEWGEKYLGYMFVCHGQGEGRTRAAKEREGRSRIVFRTTPMGQEPINAYVVRGGIYEAFGAKAVKGPFVNRKGELGTWSVGFKDATDRDEFLSFLVKGAARK